MLSKDEKKSLKVVVGIGIESGIEVGTGANRDEE